MYLEWTLDTYLEQRRKGIWMILDWSVEKADDILYRDRYYTLLIKELDAVWDYLCPS